MTSFFRGGEGGVSRNDAKIAFWIFAPDDVALGRGGGEGTSSSIAKISKHQPKLKTDRKSGNPLGFPMEFLGISYGPSLLSALGRALC